MNTTAIVPWFGSKRQLAERIVKALSEHRCYLEPFCGSLAVLLSKPVATMEIVNDLHGDLINLARHIANPATTRALFDRLQLTLVGPDIWEYSAKVIKGTPFEPTIDRAVHYFTYCWQGRNGAAGSNAGQNFCVRYTSEGGSPGTRFKNTVDSIPDWFERLRAVTILNNDAFEILDRFEDREGTVIYCDPPYLVKGAKYVHDFDKPFENPQRPGGKKITGHQRLAMALARFKKTRVVVSYYEHPDLATLYPGWKKISIEVTKSLVQQGRRGREGATKATEVLLINQNDQPELFPENNP